ncbi:MAG: 30S ribosomal protein S17 [Nitrosopumilaceae archaeon]|nr:30S ribosomal protein S17 [Nitrosopumilaceae archaeon]
MTRNIGLKVPEPKKDADPNEKNNPFNGTLAIRGKLFEGIVVKANAKNTVVIEKESPVYFTKFKRYARGKSSIHAHVPSNLDVKEGDRVLAAECRPLAKSVSFVVVEVKS